MKKPLRSNRHAVAKQNRCNDATRIYRDVARPKAVPVQTVMASRVAQVTSAEGSPLTINYPEGALDEHEPVSNHQGFLKIIEHKPGEIVVEGDPNIQEGDLLLQEELRGDPNEVMKAFEDMWMGYWGRHADTTPERWEPFVVSK